MILETLAIAAVACSIATSLILLVTRNWRWTILALAIQYLAAFYFFAVVWPLPLAVVKLVVGWMVSAVLGTTLPLDSSPSELTTRVSSRLFRFLAAGMVCLLAFSLAPAVAEWISTGMTVLWGGLILVGMGFLQMGMTTRPARVIISLLTILTGFEILYAVVETSVLVTGLLAIINLGLALAGSYLLSTETMEEAL